MVRIWNYKKNTKETKISERPIIHFKKIEYQFTNNEPTSVAHCFMLILNPQNARKLRGYAIF